MKTLITPINVEWEDYLPVVSGSTDGDGGGGGVVVVVVNKEISFLSKSSSVFWLLKVVPPVSLSLFKQLIFQLGIVMDEWREVFFVSRSIGNVLFDK